jgi:hypothetical protein
VKSFLSIFAILILPVLSTGQGLSESDSRKLAQLNDAIGQYELQADSLVEEIIQYIDSIRDVSMAAHVSAVVLLRNFNTDRVNQYLFRHFQMNFFTPGFLPDAPYLDILYDHNRFTSFLFDYSHKHSLSEDQLQFFALYLKSFMTREQILALAGSKIESRDNPVILANYQALFKLTSE